METNQDAKGDSNGEKLTLEELSKKVKELETDNFKLREQKRTFQSQIEEHQTSLREKEEKVLRESSSHKELADRYREDAEKLKNQLNEFKTRETEGKKKRAVFQELTKLGFDAKYSEEAFRLIDHSKVIVEEDTGSVLGATDIAKDFASKYAEFPYFRKRSSSGANHSSSSPTPGQLLDVRGMSKKEIAEYYERKRNS